MPLDLSPPYPPIGLRQEGDGGDKEKLPPGLTFIGNMGGTIAQTWGEWVDLPAGRDGMGGDRVDLPVGPGQNFYGGGF